MNTNILEVATFVAIVAITWFLVSINSPAIGSTDITNDVLNEVSAEDNNAKNTFMIKSGEDRAEVELTAKCNGCDKKDKLTYLWTHKGSFEKREYDEDGISFHRPISSVYEFPEFEDEEDVSFSMKTDADYWSDASNRVDLDMDNDDGFTGKWVKKEKSDEWDLVENNAQMEDTTSDKIKVQLGAGFHAFTCQISKDGAVLNLNDDEELDLVWVEVVEAPETVADLTFVLDSQKPTPKAKKKSKTKKPTTKVVPDEAPAAPAAPAGN